MTEKKKYFFQSIRTLHKNFWVASFISGDLHQKWSVVTKDQFIEVGLEATPMSIIDFENQFDLETEEKIDWATIKDRSSEYPTEKGIDISEIFLLFSKNEYFALAEQKLERSPWEMPKCYERSINLIRSVM